MKQFTAAITGLFLLLLACPSAQRRQEASADLVELDVVVLDGDDQPIRDLRQEEFEVKEDGRRVAIRTFASVAALGTADPDDARSVVLLLDDAGVGMTGTSAMKAIAKVLLSPSAAGDDIAVVRLNGHSDEAYGDVSSAIARIDSYHGGAVPFNRRQTQQDVLTAVARIARDLEPLEHRRKVIICLGMPGVCDIDEPANGAYSLLWPQWVAAISAAAQANVSFYRVDPTGLTQRHVTSGLGLVTVTGGAVFANSNDFFRTAARLWSDAGHYYLLGYWPAGTSRPLHSIDVKVTRKGAQVRARQRRGP
jgi:VWFA-related protein